LFYFSSSHAHSHGEKKDDLPAWKKKALESGNDDPMPASFGGNWTAEASVDATKGNDKMQE